MDETPTCPNCASTLIQTSRIEGRETPEKKYIIVKVLGWKCEICKWDSEVAEEASL